MRKRIIVVLLLILIVTTVLLYYFGKNSNNEDNLWKKTISKYINGDLWDEINCYDAGHVLLVPMFYAFEQHDEKRMNEFHDLFSRYADYLVSVDYNYEYWNLNHMQFNFLASNYINLCMENNCSNEIKQELLDYLYDEAFFRCLLNREKYHTENTPQYDGLAATLRDFKNGRPIADLYQYHITILFNLKEYSNNNGYFLSEERNNIIEEALEIINTIYEDGVTFTDGDKWLLNVGAFDELEEYAYMHYDSIQDNMQSMKQENTTWDTSHFSRIPVFLQIIKKANKGDKERIEYYDRLIKGLREQFLENVLIKPDETHNYYRTTNYMDSRNGLYRYNYATQQSTAYLPYQLSGTLCLGWWIFLGGEMNQIYTEIYNTFPLTKDAIQTYVGPNTTRERNEYVKLPDYFENGFAELVCLTASKLNI